METKTDIVERLFTAIVKSIYARDTQVPGLLELPVAQLRVLNVLGRGPEERSPTMSELAEALGVTLSTTTQIAERVEKRGLVERRHSDPDDRRVVRLTLTDEGRRLMQERRLIRHGRIEAAMDQLTPAQQEALTAAMEPLAAAARQLEQDEVQLEKRARIEAQADADLPRLWQEVR